MTNNKKDIKLITLDHPYNQYVAVSTLSIEYNLKPSRIRSITNSPDKHIMTPTRLDISVQLVESLEHELAGLRDSGSQHIPCKFMGTPARLVLNSSNVPYGENSRIGALVNWTATLVCGEPTKDHVYPTEDDTAQLHRDLKDAKTQLGHLGRAVDTLRTKLEEQQKKNTPLWKKVTRKIKTRNKRK